MLLRITQFGENILTEKGDNVTEFNEDLIDLAGNMIDTMYDANGIGLAAQQVGVKLQICVVTVIFNDNSIKFNFRLDGKQPPLELIMPMVLINPTINFISSHTTLYEEGCLSFPEITGEVERPDQIEVEYQDLKGAKHFLECDGLFSRVIQHEVDHLNGKLFTERMSKSEYQAVEANVKKLRKKTRLWLKENLS